MEENGGWDVFFLIVGGVLSAIFAFWGREFDSNIPHFGPDSPKHKF